MLPDFLSDLSHQIIDLPLHGTHRHLRIQQPRRTDDLLHPVQLMRRFILGRRSGYEQHLINMGFKLLKIQRPVVQRRRKPEAVLHQRVLSGTVPREHAADLRDRHMGLIHDDQEIIREEIQQRHGRLSRRGSVQMPGIVFNAGTEARLPQHLNVKIRPLRNPLSLQQLVLALEIPDSLLQLLFYIFTGNVDFILRNHIMRRRENGHMLQRGNEPSAQRIHLGDPIDFVPEEFHPDQIVAALCRIDLQNVPAHPEAASSQVHIVPVILKINQLPDYRIPVLRHSRPERHDLILILVRAAQTVDTGHAGNHHNVPPLCQGRRSRQAELVDLVIDGRVLRNIGIR